MSDVGFKVQEGVASGVSPFQLPPKRNIGLLMERHRGVPGKPQRISSPEEDLLIFGGIVPNMYGPVITKHIFENADQASVVLFGCRVVGTGTAVATGTAVLTGAISLTVEAAYLGQDDPGSWANGAQVKIYRHNSKARNAYYLEVLYLGRVVENYSASTCALLQATVNAQSKYCTITISAEPLVTDNIDKTVTLSGGVYVAPTEADFYPVPDVVAPKGLACFDGYNVQLIAVTENHTVTMAQASETYARGRGDCAVVAVTPLLATQAQLEAYATALQKTTASYIAVYNAWVATLDNNSNTITVPALGCLLGAAYLRTPYVQGDAMHIPPGGTDAAFVGIQNVFPERVGQDRINQLTGELSINSIAFTEGVGFYPISSRTMSTNPLYHSVHVRLLTNYYVKALDRNMKFTVQKPNTPELKREAYASLYTFFKAEYDNGALERSIPFAEACKIAFPKTAQRKDLDIVVEWIPTECTEAVKLQLNRNDALLITKAVE